MKRSLGKDLLDDEARSSMGSASTSSKLMDLQLGLLLDESDNEIRIQGSKNMKDYDPSINQSYSFIKCTPAIVDFALQKTTSNQMPEVRLAIWQAALFSKRKSYNWDTSMPMPGVIVDRDRWDLYITFERNGNLVSNAMILETIALTLAYRL